MSTLIFGAGAIGQWLGALLSSCGVEVQLYGRPRVAKALQQNGGVRLGDLPPVDLAFSHRLTDLENKHYSSVICTVKTFAVEAALLELSCIPGLEFDSLISFQNGWGSEAIYEEIFPAKELWALTTTRAVGVEAPGVLYPSDKGGFGIAPWTTGLSSQKLPKALRKVSLPLVVPKNGRDLKWSKLLLNLIGNVTGAVTGLAPAKLASNSQLMKLEIRLIKEALAVGKAMGIQRVDLPGFPVRLFSKMAETLPVGVVAPLVAAKMKKARGDKLPSIFDDLEYPEKATEVDLLNGAVITQGLEHGVPTPLQSGLVSIFHQCRDDSEFWHSIRQNPRKLVELLS